MNNYNIESNKKKQKPRFIQEKPFLRLYVYPAIIPKILRRGTKNYTAAKTSKT